MRVKPMFFAVGAVLVLCMMQMGETSKALQHPDDQNYSKLFQDANKEMQKNFLADYDAEITHILNALPKTEKNVKDVVEYMDKELQTLKNDVDNHLSKMADHLINFLKPEMKTNVGDERRSDFRSFLSNDYLLAKYIVYNFIVALSKLDPKLQDEIVQITLQAAEFVIQNPSTLKLLNNVFDVILQVTKSQTLKSYVPIGLAGVFLFWDVYVNINLWWNDEISGERLTKNIIESLAGLAGAIGGSYVGAEIGTLFLPGIGTFVGGLFGGVVGSIVSRRQSLLFIYWLTENIFNLPKGEALKNAYKFLELEDGASHDEINSHFKYLALEYHPQQKSGDMENWQKLQYFMQIIKCSKGKCNRPMALLM